MRYGLVAAIAAVATTASPLSAQQLEGTGSHASPLFALDAGLAVFDVEHHGRGRFTVLLLDERAEVVARLADTAGAYSGSTAVRVPRSGRYLLDVEADGPWTIRLRGAPADVFAPAAAKAAADPAPLREARLAGEAAADAWSWGWFARGLVGGALAGPIGAGFVVHRAGRSDIPPPPDPATAGPRFLADYRNAYADRLIARRKAAAFAGGIIGSTAFLLALLQWLDVGGDGGRSGSPSGPEPQLSVRFVITP